MSRDFLKQRLQSLQGEAVNGQPASISSPLGWHGFLLRGKVEDLFRRSRLLESLNLWLTTRKNISSANEARRRVRQVERDTLALGQWFAEGHPLFE